jgi:hypothetical protein
MPPRAKGAGARCALAGRAGGQRVCLRSCAVALTRNPTLRPLPAGREPPPPPAPVDVFEAVPDEVLLLILRQLPLDTLLRCGALGRRWRRVLDANPALFCTLTLETVTARGSLDNAALTRLCRRAAAGGGLRLLDLSTKRAALVKGVSPEGLVWALGAHSASYCQQLRTLGCAKKLLFSVASAQRLFAGSPALQTGSIALDLDTKDAHYAMAILPPAFTVSLRAVKYKWRQGTPYSLPAILNALAARDSGRVTALDLHMSESGFGAPTGHALARLLRASATLRTLDLSVCYHAFQGPNPHPLAGAPGGGLALVQALEENTALTELDVSYTSFGEDEAVAMGAVLRVNRTLTRLNLGSTKMGAQGAAALAAGLAANATLTELDVSSGRLGADGVGVIAAALRSNATLTRLHLPRNAAGVAGAEALVAALAGNTTLTRIYFHGNGLLAADLRRLRATASGARVQW